MTIEMVARKRCEREGINPDSRYTPLPGGMFAVVPTDADGTFPRWKCRVPEIEKEISDFSAAGLVVVPKEPTEAMVRQGFLADVESWSASKAHPSKKSFAAIYKAMIEEAGK